jgi:hypothetical protein
MARAFGVRHRRSSTGSMPCPNGVSSSQEADALKKLALHLSSMTPDALRRAADAGELIEVDCDGQEELSDIVGCS